ncbi:2-oxoglutarate ferredoxin oxidoreductase subunit beta [Helicobacter heilmannii]|uniref:2-oxoglutarate oxidoreductase, beta subunit n=3 Tax=Helicobacter heilmannii TaxID=35817 RepID=A0A0K2XGV0_HELHE|nr:2-oxoglutarate ferredoxin oxidoreductase subunit beta [Helicobacter heilmannii]CRF46571.1 2-oxoglutarate oxidoreductase, beta subunit [Helicobacter heilmannii]CRF48862.1 2-oxoglutarate oxidoreductase, beta subunit [Helicobacter heilmannii]CRF50292.1 2-oxoglutarate oxidoreductase, beta subunit [Helicobacter heilmannii]CRI34181.1 2-oxoglutarate oxidoreductase, beta subunit [Helicobacter heilmannii]BDQ27250.1 2-oxoglutarate ferredoxin oxidoreductase subunit beta [Helicobacter heilmannii]
MAFDYDTYLRVDKTPTLWCWGCGDGVILKSIIRAIDTLGWDMDDVCFVSGIGCSGRMSSYVNCNTVHTTHGRALAYATGIKMANPTKHVIVVSGDGDSFAIGGNHTIHACRRNIDLNLVLVDNFIYGLTNSQTSPTTPNGMWTVTAQGGNIDNSFDPCEIAIAAGASFVGRESVLEPKKLERILADAFSHKGFSFVDVHSNCHINLGRKNKMGEAAQTLKWIESRLVSRRKYEEMTLEERVGKFPTGILKQDASKIEYCQAYQGVIDRAQAKKA